MQNQNVSQIFLPDVQKCHLEYHINLKIIADSERITPQFYTSKNILIFT